MFCNKRINDHVVVFFSRLVLCLRSDFPIAKRQKQNMHCIFTTLLQLAKFKPFKITLHIKFDFKINLELVSFGSFGYLIVGLVLFVPDELRENMLDGAPSAVKWAVT